MKKFLFVQHQGSYTNLSAQEGFDALLMGSAFVDCSLLFMDDGVFQLLEEQESHLIQRKNFIAGFGALKDYGVEKIYCSQSALQARNIKEDSLNLDVLCIKDAELSALFDHSDVILSF
ncbi:MAG: tRNA 2-thiouridine synthesizing protein C [Candidatus Azotimanducaceae bacterium]|jgi:tRNA 2-thiouridine synthesizing protein C